MFYDAIFTSVSQDIVRLHFIPFSLKDVVKKWMQSLHTNSITIRNGFVYVFLRKYFPNGGIIKFINKMNHFLQLDIELF